LFEIREQDSTDFDKALRSIDAPLVIGVGFLGGRLDHQLAVLSTLLRHHDRPCALLGAQELVFHLPPVLDLDLAPGAVVSLFPMQPVTGRSEGLEWPIDGLDLAPGGRVGTSNRARGRVRIETDGPGLLAMVPRAALDAVMRAIATARSGR
jgi:thiamine pyrophosphokinase